MQRGVATNWLGIETRGVNAGDYADVLMDRHRVSGIAHRIGCQR